MESILGDFAKRISEAIFVQRHRAVTRPSDAFVNQSAVFATTSNSTILDRHDYEGTILELIEEAQKYILKNIHIGMRLEGLYRVYVQEISTAAMREAIINAFCHRDYRDPEEVRVAIFKDRVEIRNPGKLFGGLTIEDLRKGNVSKRRNPLSPTFCGASIWWEDGAGVCRSFWSRSRM